MKTDTSANLNTHLASGEVTLAVCLRAVRTDDVEFGFTSLDIDIPFESLTYEADSVLVTRTELESSSTMNVDDMEFSGITSDVITEADLRNGVWDNCEVYLFMVNYKSLGDGAIKMARGRIGNVTLGANSFQAELRRMLQNYSRTILKLHTLECSANFCDSKCSLTKEDYRSLVRVGSVTDNQTFIVEEFVEAVTLGMSLTNPGAEDGDITGWIEEGFNFEATTVKTRTGTYGFVCKDNHSGCVAYQRVNLVTQGVPTAAIDLGEASWEHALWVNPDPGKTGQTRIRFLDTSQVEISTTALTTTPTADTWTQIVTSADIPVGTRYIDIMWLGGGGSFSPYAYFDDATAEVVYVDRAPGTPDEITGLDVDDYFINGWIQWLTGDNTGAQMEIIIHTGATQEVTLFLPTKYNVAEDDEFYLFRGCNNTLTQCRDDFSNLNNYRGFPYLPLKGSVEYPDAQP